MGFRVSGLGFRALSLGLRDVKLSKAPTPAKPQSPEPLPSVAASGSAFPDATAA